MRRVKNILCFIVIGCTKHQIFIVCLSYQVSCSLAPICKLLRYHISILKWHHQHTRYFIFGFFMFPHIVINKTLMSVIHRTSISFFCSRVMNDKQIGKYFIVSNNPSKEHFRTNQQTTHTSV